MANFTEKIADFVFEKDFDLRQLVIILPSERAVKYVAKALVARYQKPIFSPEITTINRWVKKYVPPVIDKTRLLLLLFEMYQETEEGKNAVFEDFLNWGTILLSDFDDLDRYLLNHNQVFRNLKAIKELESWKIDEQQYSASQLKFMEFWDRIPDYYERLLEKINAKEMITSSLAYRKVAENIDLIHDRAGKQFIFAGFNALSTAELTIIKKLMTLRQASFLMDADRFYYENAVHEAGSFLRRNSEFLEIAKPIFIQDDLSKKELEIDIIECAQHTGQAKVAATELAKMSPDEINKTLVLLADESLISAVVKNIPANVGKANITLGLPLSQTPIKTWVELLFEIQENKQRFRTKAIYYKDLQRLINHVFTIASLNTDEQTELTRIELQTIRNNRIFQQVGKISSSERTQNLLSIVTEDWNQNWLHAIETIRKINSLLLSYLPDDKAFERTSLQVFDESIINLEQIIREGIPTMSLKSFKSLFFQHWQRKSIAFHGNPTKGLQIMGLLETRLLDFENLIVLGLNEGKLPNNNPIKTIIPMDLRYGLGLPSSREKQGLFAHHFYRLLHQAKKAVITYTTAIEKIGSNEAGRYIAQIELELARINKNIRIKRDFYSIPIPKIKENNLSKIDKTPEIKERILQFFEKDISASALNKYLACPLDFYYRYLAEFGEDQDVEEEIENNTFGTFIHNTLEILFKPFAHYDDKGEKKAKIPSALSLPAIDTMIAEYGKILHQQFLDYFNGDSSLFLKGRNLLSYEMAMEITKNLLLKEREFVRTSEDPVEIIMLEQKLRHEMTLDYNGEKKTIHFSGFIDRIDRIGEKYRVIDYKSGKVTDKDVKFNPENEDIQQAFIDCKHALQLSLYCLFFKNKFGKLPDEAKIISLINISEDFRLQSTKPNYDLASICEQFESLASNLFSELLDETICLEHNTDARFCNYCN